MRSKMPCSKKTVLMRSSGISMPRLDEDALAAHDAVAGEHEVGADPLDEAHEEPAEVDDDPQRHDAS